MYKGAIGVVAAKVVVIQGTEDGNVGIKQLLIAW
jgi:dipeptidyl aminopeptidase/acylaminoacyl peptidase